MSKLEELIAEYCTNGVEYKPLWEITVWDKRFNAVERYKQPRIIEYPYLLAAELFSLNQNKGDVFLLSTGEKTGWTSTELAGSYLCEGEVVSIPWGKSRPVKEVIKYFKGKFITADNRIATSSNKNNLSNRYLYYCLLNQSETIDSYYRGSGIKHPSMKDVLDSTIPIPPLPVQEEIVRILDKFTTLEAELEAELEVELEARKKQYEYYSNYLLLFRATPYHTLESLCEIADYRGKTPKKVDDGVFLITAKNVRKGFIDYEKSKEYIAIDDYENVMHRGYPQIGDILITTEAPCGNVAQIDKENIALAQRIIKYRPKSSKLNSTFLKYILLGREFQEKLLASATGGTVKGIKGSRLHKLTIPLPPLAEQERIVSILDRFDSLVNDFSQGLPAEIEARRKQYVYYRNQLLTFKEATS